ncbi:MAG: hypothetical protein NZ805_13565 [Armatimonadetes bacterium]|nr:hypothetical protein [Armatimonadota bacterium]MDW8030005.1 hypothetical protein [Armatimonadota bacterium]
MVVGTVKRGEVIKRNAPYIGYIGTYVPRGCGIITFAADVVKSVHAHTFVGEPYVAAMVKPDEDLSR